MMGFGPYGSGSNGGSYLSPTSSNLSASAPPFTIDRSGPKNPSCPLVDLTEPSYPGPPMNSSLHNWLPSRSPTSEPKFFSSHQFELNSVPSSNAYGYGGLQTIESSNLNAHLAHLSTTVSASVDGFSYCQSSDSGATGFVEAKPYYPSYLSPASRKEGPLGIPDHTSYDWLSSSSSSRVAALDGSSKIDYSKKILDSEFPGQWSGMWNGFAEWKQGKQGQLDGSLCSKETGRPVSAMYENYMNQESQIPKGLSRGEEASFGIKILDLEKHGGSVNTEKLDDQSLLGKTSNFVPVDYSRPILGSLSGFPETHLESPSFIFGTNSGNNQIPYGGSNEKRSKHQANNSTSILMSSSGLVIGPRAVGSSSSAPNNAPFKTLNFGSNTTGKDMPRNKACGIKDSHSQLSSEHNLVFESSQISVHLERDDPLSSVSFFSKKEDTLNKECITNDTLPDMLKVKSGLQTSNVSHDGFNLDLNVNENINSVEDSSESVDHYNPAVDSPCWKGVPVTRSSPFDASSVVPEMRKLEVCIKSNVQGKQTFPLNTGDKVFYQKPNEKNILYHQFGCSENVSEFPLNTSSVTNSEFGEQKSDDIARVGYHSETKGIKISDDSHEDGSRSIGCSDLKTSQITKQNLQRDGLTSENINETMQDSSSLLPFLVERVISPSVGDASSKLTKSNEGPSTPTVDVLMLVSTIRNLSELLMFHCTSGSYQLKQKDLEAVQSVINNLSVCLSKHSEDTSDHPMELNDLHMGLTEDSPKMNKTVGLKPLFDGHNVQKGYSCLSGKTDDEMLDSVSVRDALEMVDEDKATQALKKVLTENFHDEEETQPQTLLYKNLWLEAEAALCSLNYKARYNRMKIEMEKFKLPKSIDAHEDTITTDVKNLSRSEASPHPNAVDTLSPKAEGCLTTKSQESSVLSTSSQTDDVMTRFHILKCRIEKSNPDTVANVDKPSSSKASPDYNKVGKILSEAHEENIGSPKPDISLQASSNCSTNNPTNKFEASVLARFRILKSRVDNCSPVSTEEQQSPEIVNLEYASERQHWPLIGHRSDFGSSDVQPEPTLQHHAADSTEGQLTDSEFHMLVNDDPSVQSHRTNRPEDLLSMGWFDRMSSDWEHVKKEDLGFQNR